MPKTDWNFSKQGYIDVPGGRIWYGVVSGGNAGATPLLAIHGGPGMSHDYLYPLVDLADERPIVFYDQLDAGLSDRPNDPANWRIERFLSEIDVVREYLDPFCAMLSVLILFATCSLCCNGKWQSTGSRKGVAREKPTELSISAPLQGGCEGVLNVRCSGRDEMCWTRRREG